MKSTVSRLDADSWIANHGEALFRFAMMRCRRADIAEDLVQDALVSAWRVRERFDGRASERTWLTAILKNKLIDWLRKSIRDRDRSIGDDDWLADQFAPSGKWSRQSAFASNPSAGMEREEFHQSLAGCLDKLPPRLHRVFALWHLDEDAKESICESVGIRLNHLWVLLFRARIRLASCLKHEGFGPERSGEEESA